MSEEQINQSLLDQSNALLPVLVGEAEKEKAAKKKEKDAEEKKKRVRLPSAMPPECPHNELICAFFVVTLLKKSKSKFETWQFIQEEAAAERKKEAMKKAAENKKLKEEADERKAEEKKRKVSSAVPTTPNLETIFTFVICFVLKLCGAMSCCCRRLL